jgi:hypothetical protein
MEFLEFHHDLAATFILARLADLARGFDGIVHRGSLILVEVGISHLPLDLIEPLKASLVLCRRGGCRQDPNSDTGVQNMPQAFIYHGVSFHIVVRMEPARLA